MVKNRVIILSFYIVFSLVVVLCSLSSLGLQNLGLCFLTIELVVAYFAHARWPHEESFEENHTTFIIRTIWIYNLIYLIGAVIAFVQIGLRCNPDGLLQMKDAITYGSVDSTMELLPYAKKYITDNQALITDLMGVWSFPAQLYLVWRILRGGQRAFKGYRIASPRSWV